MPFEFRYYNVGSVQLWQALALSIRILVITPEYSQYVCII